MTEVTSELIDPCRFREHSPPGRLVRRALHTYHRHFRRVIGAAVPLFLPLAILEAIVLQFVGYDPRAGWAGLISLLVLSAIDTLTIVLGWEFYLGLLDRVVGEDQHGHPRYSIGDVVRTLPYARLAAVSLLLWVVFTLFSLAGTVPGLLVFSFLALAGPIITTEGVSVARALLRSLYLAGGAFLTTLLLVTLPLGLEGALTWLLDEALHSAALWILVLAEGLLAVVVSPLVGVIEVTLAHELMAKDRLPGR